MTGGLWANYSRIMRPLPWALVALCACTDAYPGENQNPAHPLGFETWDEQFPIRLQLSPRVPGRWYAFSRRQALERVIANLQGNCTREAWLFAKDFFHRAPEEAIEPLIETMDRAFLSPGLGELVQNTVEAMGRMADPRFADALLRALEHDRANVRNAALQSMARSGTPDVVRRTYTMLPFLDLTSKRHWIESARIQLGANALPMYAELLQSGAPIPFQVMLDEVLKMPPAQAAELLRSLWPDARGDLKVIIAGVFHAVGDGAGTAVLQQALRGGDATLVRLAIQGTRAGDLQPLLEDILRQTLHPDADVRAEAVLTIADLPGENITDTLQLLAATSDDWIVQAEALAALVRRGHRDEMDRIIEQLNTVTGTALSRALDLVQATGDGVAVPVILARYAKTPPGEGRGFLQAIAFTRAPEAFEPLTNLFLGEERAVEPTPTVGVVKTTMNYIPTLLLNLEGVEQEMIQLFHDLPREDVRRRAYMLDTLGKNAAEHEGAAASTQIYGLMRGMVLDRQESPQMRLAALTYLRRDLTLEDAMAIKGILSEEDMPMRRALSDFLFDLF